MQGSVEIRTPFLDPGVIRLALNMAFEHRFGPDSKGVLRDLVRERFGTEVADRPKQPFWFGVADYIESDADPEFLREGRLRELLGSRSAAVVPAPPPQQRQRAAAPLDRGDLGAALPRGTLGERVEGELWR